MQCGSAGAISTILVVALTTVPQIFKGILLSNLADFYGRSTQKDKIRNTIDANVKAMATSACDANWNCNSVWTGTQGPVESIHSQLVAASLLVSALAVHPS